ncbi:MAG: hypothetical protein FWC50_05680 [Planctomycetaceae bacterium]|nr:hypothetical protein [Planctomycetaceae bacterium]
MKTRLLLPAMTLLACVIGVGMLQAQEIPPSLFTAKLEVYPKEIYYGDIFFNRVKVHNDSEKTIWFLIHTKLDEGMNVVLKQNDAQVYQWWGGSYLWGREFFPIHLTFAFGGPGKGLQLFHEVAAHTTGSVFLRPLWFPMLEFSDTPEALELEKAASSGRQQYLVKFSSCYEEDSEKDFTSLITVKPRPREDFELLREWFLELPGTKDTLLWMEDAVFTAPFYTRESPIQTKVYSREEAEEKLWPFFEAYGKFIKPFSSRSPEALARIKRTNELAAKILERAKEPDSTFSQNMIEFIQLRGFLVDMRYAENLEAEKAAFVKMMDFIDQSQDKELWIDFMYDVGLESILNNEYFPYAKVFKYKQRFAERMQIKNLCRSFEDYGRIYGFPKKGFPKKGED